MDVDKTTSAVILVQCDWSDALKEENGKAWITFKKRGEPGQHSYLRSDGSDETGRVSNVWITSSDFELVGDANNDVTIQVQHKDSDLRFKIVKPEATFTNIHSKTLTCLDVSSGGLGISCEYDKIFVWETDKGALRRCLEGHLGDVYTCRLFPSGIVVLSGSADMRIRIWSAEDGSCPRTLIGHRSPIVDVQVVEKGMNVVGISKDGSILLWSCGKNRVIEPEMKVEETLTCADIFTVNESFNGSGDAQVMEVEDEDEVGTENKLLIVGGENGIVAILNLRSREILRQTKIDCSVNCVKFLSSHICLVGGSDGSIVALGVDDLKPRHTIHDSDSPVTSFLAGPGAKSGFFAGKQDGSCIWYNFSSNERIILSGSDVDPIYSIVTDNKFVFTGARDGKIRKYNLENIFG